MRLPTAGSRMFRLLEWLGVALLFAALTVVVFWPLPPQALTHAYPHHDTLFNMWRLSWIAEALSTNPARLFDPPIFHPATRVLAFSDAVLLQGLLATPLLIAGAPILPVSNLILLLGPWTSALGAYLLVRELLRDCECANPFWPSVVAGTIFGLLPYRIEHVMHLELQWSQWMPLACWALYRTVRAGRVRDGILTAVFVLAQFLSCIYYGVFLVLILGLTAPVLLLIRRRAASMAIARALVVGGVLCAVPLIAYSTPYRANQQTFGGRGTKEIKTWSATPGSFVSTPHYNRVYGETWKYGSPEGRLFPGLLALVLGAGGLWAMRRRPVAWMFGGALVLSSVLAMGTNTPVYRVVLALPMMGGLRAPARFGMIAALALAVLAGFGAARLLARVPRRSWHHACGVLLIAGLTAEYASSVGPLQAYLQRAPLYAVWLKQKPGGTVIDLPIARTWALPHYEAEWSFYGRTHGHPLANGYSGYYPRAYLELLEAMIQFPRGTSIEALRARDVRYIVMHEERYEPADLMELVARMEGTPGLRFIGRFPDTEYPTTIFAVEP